MATESNPADMLTKAVGRSKVEEICAEIGQTEPHAKTVDKKPKDVKKLKKVKLAEEAVETNDATIKNKSKDARVAEIKNESKDATLRWDAYYGLNSAKWSSVENGQVAEGFIEPSDVVVVGTLQRE